MSHLDILRNLTVLLVEDDPYQRELMAEILPSFFQRLLVAEHGAAGLALFKRQPIHVVIADLRMPVMDGLTMAAEIRQLDAKMPILITSAYAEAEDLLVAIRLHFIDYVLKPMSWDRLKASLEEVATHILENNRYVLQIAKDVRFWPQNSKVLHNNQEITLTTKEKALLNLLVAHCGSTVHRERIFQLIYQNDPDVSDAALKNLVMKLRRKIGDGTIVNSYGEGYMLRLHETS